MQKKKAKIILLLFVTMCFVFSTLGNAVASDQSYPILKLYSQGSYVKTLQTKLQGLGFYWGSIDGIFGWKTMDAVKRFQASRGLVADGVVGAKTWTSLLGWKVSVSRGEYNRVAAPPAPNVANVAAWEKDLLARLIHAESRGEPYIGQVAVGAVVLNRVKSPEFPNSIYGVIYQPWAFSVVNDGQIYMPADQTSVKAATDALKGWDPSGGALFYYNPAKTTSNWIYSRPVINRIGDHVFAL